MKTSTIEQSNTYNVKDSMGRSTDFYVIASNIKEACSEVKRIAKEEKYFCLITIK